MRGRKPLPVVLESADVALLQRLARNEAALGSGSAAPASSWAWPRASASATWPDSCAAASPPSVAPCAATSAPACRGCWRAPRDEVARPGFPPLQRAEVVQLACLEPAAKGLHITHWTSADLARQAVADGITDRLSPRSVRRILAAVDLQPHRSRYWRTARPDARFKERAEMVLWCYANAVRLARRGIWVVCADEIPNLQVLERTPIRRAIPGHVEQREFEY